VSARTCIYCLTTADEAAFNREHVLPEAFGRFKNNLPRLRCVCKGCNDFFSKNLELFFHRDSLEALRRLQTGLKPLRETRDFPLDRLSLSLEEPGEWEGVRLAPWVENGNLVVGPVSPQVGLAHKRGLGWIYVTERELEDPAWEFPNEADPEGGIKVIAPSDEAVERLVALLSTKGIPFKKRGDLSPPPTGPGQILVAYHCRIDPIIQRCAAKIAFNYMASVADPDFALLPDFSVIRSYIRWGTSPGYTLVRVSGKPILYDDLPWLRQTDGHLLTLGWSPRPFQNHVVAQVSLFNTFTYEVLLAQNCSSVWRDIRSGHHFDISERLVARLARFSGRK